MQSIVMQAISIKRQSFTIPKKRYYIYLNKTFNHGIR
jgi:hypothetical protein